MTVPVSSCNFIKQLNLCGEKKKNFLEKREKIPQEKNHVT